ncbi:MAG: type I methionyl aminopeptidase [Azoarcus sp.]|jgi:methionyl aminopeptidase|nr:type I methionyl aminopeptidase [Azoarcus sp.]
MSIGIKTPEEITEMRLACRLAAEVLDYVTPFVKAGVTTGKLDQLCSDYMTQVQHTTSATLNYQPPGYSPYPASICTSLNHQVCHGIPGGKALKKGDILNIDVTVVTPNGFFGDTSRMFIVGEGSIFARRLCQVTFECMWLGIAAVRGGAHLGDIGHVIQRHAEGNGFSVVREFCGHGIGRRFHEEPQVLHYGTRGSGPELKPGMIFTIEPMINAGKAAISELPDGWTIVTKDRSLSAQFEHTILVTETGAEVLSLSAGCEPPPKLITGALAENTARAIAALPSAPQP